MADEITGRAGSRVSDGAGNRWRPKPRNWTNWTGPWPYRQLTGEALVGSPEEMVARYESVHSYDDGETIDVYSVLERSGAYPINDTTQWAAMPPAPAATYADFIRTQAEGEYAFMTGTRSFEEWETYVETLNSIGLAEWTAQAEARARELGIIQ